MVETVRFVHGLGIRTRTIAGTQGSGREIRHCVLASLAMRAFEAPILDFVKIGGVSADYLDASGNSCRATARPLATATFQAVFDCTGDRDSHGILDCPSASHLADYLAKLLAEAFEQIHEGQGSRSMVISIVPEPREEDAKGFGSLEVAPIRYQAFVTFDFSPDPK